MSVKKSKLRQQARKIIYSDAFVKGYLLYRTRVCGNKRCQCYQGQEHPALYLVVHHKGKKQQIFIPHTYEKEVKYWIAQHQKLRQLIDDLSDIHLKKIQNREL